MNQQFKTPSGWEDLKPGTRIFLSDEPTFGLHENRWLSQASPVLARVVSPLVQGSQVLVMLDVYTLGAFSLKQSMSATNHVIRKMIEAIVPGERRFFWICAPEAVRLYDPTYLSELTAFGNHTCKCGAMNKDVAASSIVNGQYACYSCRVIMPRERAA